MLYQVITLLAAAVVAKFWTTDSAGWTRLYVHLVLLIMLIYQVCQHVTDTHTQSLHDLTLCFAFANHANTVQTYLARRNEAAARLGPKQGKYHDHAC